MPRFEINEAPAAQLAKKNKENTPDPFGLKHKDPALSAGHFAKLNFGFLIITAIIVIMAQFYPEIEFWLIPLLIICSLQGLFYWAGLYISMTSPKRSEWGDPLLDNELPIITLIVPVYNEANMMPQIRQMLRRLNYPTDKLEVLILNELHDSATREAFFQLDWLSHVRLFVVPPGAPQTKARACNFGLFEACGSITGIIDAEDWPHPDQLFEVAHRFHTAPMTCAGFQAPLVIKPRSDKILQSLFALEYHILFRFLLPAWIVLGAPAPLSGSANFFRTDILKQLGGWDKFNLTEDADIGIRFKRFGYSLGMLDTGSLENAPNNFKDWFWQRTRWSSGHFQTLMVHIRHPKRLCAEIGLLSLMLFIASFGARVVTGIARLMLILVFSIDERGLITYLLTSPIGQLSLFTYSGRIACYITIAITGVPYVNRITVLLLPIYWLLQIPPSLWGISLAIFRCFKWHKTPHEPYLP